ncbi:MAG: type II secretion system protein [Bdellovibrionota bacterium]
MRNARGFTLLEVMIALMVFSIVMGGMVPAFVAQLRQNTLGEIRTESIAAGQIILDQLRFLDPTTLPRTGSDAARNVVVGTRTYSVVISYCENSSFCSTANNRHLTARVSYNNVQYFETQTVFTQLR